MKSITKKVELLLYIKLFKLVENGANIFYFLTPNFCQIGYFRGPKIQKWD